MLTVESLKAAGADTDEGISRCANNEAFYLKIVGMVLDNEHFDKLSEAIASGDLKAGFESAHALKGLVGNVSLTPLAAPIIEITEHLRAGEEMDYSSLLKEIESNLAVFRDLR